MRSSSLLALLTFAALAAAAPAPGEAAPQAAAEEADSPLASIDTAKLYADKAYAETILRHIDAAAPQLESEPDMLASVELLRAAALGTLGRHDEALAAAGKAVAARPGDGSVRAEAVFTAARADRPLVAAEAIEAAARAVREPEQIELLRQGLYDNLVHWVRGELREAKAQPQQDRLTAALLAIQWPSPDRPGMLDTHRQALIKARLPGDPAGAKALLAEMTDPAPLLPLLVSRRYDALFASDAERLARLAAAIAAFDKGSAERLRRNPDHPDIILDRAQFLRSVGREQEALAILMPWARDLERVEKGGEKAFWLVNEAAYALRALGRADEAVTLMEKLIALDMDAHPYLINMAINHGELLNSAKRHAEAARYAEGLFATGKAGASPYGHMWMWSAAACGHARAGDAAKATPWLERLAASSDKNEAAHLRALLCTGNLDAAEALMLKRLAGEDSDHFLIQLQDHQLDEGGVDPLLRERMTVLRARPAVAAAIARSGHILTLPLSRTYWGDY